MMDTQPRLLLVNLSREELRVNDALVPAVSVLRERDQFRLGSGPAWRLAVFNKPRVEAPSEEEGRESCPVCLKPLHLEPMAYFCQCGVAMHFQAKKDECCALTVGDCLSCGRAVVLEEGYTGGAPDFEHD